SGEACVRALRARVHGERIHYVGPERDLHMLAQAGLAPATLDEAEAVLCTGLFDDSRETPEDYAEAITSWRARSLPMLCANPDVVVDRGTQRLWCAGALAEAYARAGGEVIWFGKPHAPVYEQSLALLRELMGKTPDPARVLAIGDGIATDVSGALAFGLDVLFVGGGLAAAELGGDPEHPDPALLERWLAAQGQAPQFTIGRLR
ncbi:MAG: HAD hydrolase-like protein, partial [Pseudomonadota bacterium]